MPGLAAADAYTGVRSRVRKALLDAPEQIYVVPFISEYFGAFKTSLVTIMGSLQVWRRTKALAYPEDWILTRLAFASAGFNIRCECIAVAAKHCGPGGHGNDERKRLAKVRGQPGVGKLFWGVLNQGQGECCGHRPTADPASICGDHEQRYEGCMLTYIYVTTFEKLSCICLRRPVSACVGFLRWVWHLVSSSLRRHG
ncbi:unnamed protein product [Symbiodinium necroappetens]|uniref:Uncharacterized protein n=1 Tax=Symbiodinium necroappetens TaxID=1628268 RepID=A0A812ZGS3_9DINO|nr:unnamed protein product [Symbiodinium necroappetens]